MISSIWAQMVLYASAIIAALSGWLACWRINKKLKESKINNVLSDVARIQAESELKELKLGYQLTKEMKQKTSKLESGVDNATIDDPISNLNSAIRGK